MEEKKKLLAYTPPAVAVTRFEAGDCIQTSDMSFGNSENWGENIPSNGWT